MHHNYWKSGKSDLQIRYRCFQEAIDFDSIGDSDKGFIGLEVAQNEMGAIFLLDFQSSASYVGFNSQILQRLMKGLVKLFTGLGALILLLVGIGLLAATIYGYVNSSIFLGDANTKNIVLGIMLGISLAVIGGSAEGLYGICRERPKLICGFQIIVIIFMIIFIGAGVGFIILPEQFFNGDCKTSSNTVINYASEIYNASYNSYCKTCTCALDRTNLSPLYNQSEIDIINTTYNNTDPINGFRTSSDCLNSLSDPQRALFATIAELQKMLECSAWCDGSDFNLFYRFSDIGGGRPSSFCYSRLVTFFNDFSYYGKIGFFTGGGVLFLMFACNIYLCCSPQRRKRKNMRERFMLVVESEDDDYYRR